MGHHVKLRMIRNVLFYELYVKFRAKSSFFILTVVMVDPLLVISDLISVLLAVLFSKIVLNEFQNVYYEQKVFTYFQIFINNLHYIYLDNLLQATVIFSYIYIDFILF